MRSGRRATSSLDGAKDVPSGADTNAAGECPAPCPAFWSTDLSASNRLSPVGWDRLMCWFKIIKSYRVLEAERVHEVYVTHSECGCQPKKGK